MKLGHSSEVGVRKRWSDVLPIYLDFRMVGRRVLKMLGKKFSSLDEVNNFIKEYEDEHRITLYKRDSKTIESIKSNKPLRYGSSNKYLKYYFLKYACYKGGKIFKSNTKDLRKFRTQKDGCPMNIQIGLDDTGKFLIVKKLDEAHNHSIIPDSYYYLPKVRKLNDEQKNEAIKMLKLKCNKKLVAQYMKENYNKHVTPKDLDNVKTKIISLDYNFEEISKMLKKNDPNNIVEILFNNDQSFEGIFYQDSEMQEMYKKYPEVLLCDATYRLNYVNMPLYILMVVDGNNNGEIVSIFILQEETTENIEIMLNLFKQSSPESWPSTNVVFTDKDFKERKCFLNVFPNAKLCLCLLHTLKCFESTITMESMKMTSSQRDACLKVLQKMTFSKTNEEYERHFHALKCLGLSKVLNYIIKNWEPIRDEWVEGLKKQNTTFNIFSTNHIESLNKTLKQVITRNGNLTSFFEDLLITISEIRNERKVKAYDILNKNKVNSMYEIFSPQDNYNKYLTPFAADIVITQLELAEKVRVLSTNGSYCQIKCEQKNINVSTASCECSLFINMTLPCKHIFAVRKHFNQELFSEELIKDRFSKQFFIQNQAEVFNAVDTENIVIISNSNVPKCEPKILNSHEKYKESIDLLQNIASALSDYGHVQFSEIFEKLKNLKTYIDERIPFTIDISSQVSVEEQLYAPVAATPFIVHLQEVVLSAHI